MYEQPGGIFIIVHSTRTNDIFRRIISNIIVVDKFHHAVTDRYWRTHAAAMQKLKIREDNGK